LTRGSRDTLAPRRLDGSVIGIRPVSVLARQPPCDLSAGQCYVEQVGKDLPCET
jgi:hypothetical protein